MGKVKTIVADVQEQLAIEYFKGFDDIDELCDRVATQLGVPADMVSKIFEDMPKDD
jgi:hypothetical protein